MLSCKKVAELASQSLDSRLSFRQRIAFRMHLMVCDLCSQYVAQLRFLHKSMSSYDEHFDSIDSEIKLSDERREQIRQVIKENK